MRDYLVVFIILASLPIGIIRPYYGLLVYTWVSYMYPQMLAWSFAQSFPIAKLAAFSATAGLLLKREGDTAPLSQRETVVMALLWVTFTISSVFAFNSTAAWGQWQDVSKLIVMALLGSMLLTDQKRIRYFLLVIAMSIGFYGIKGGIFSIVTGGEQTVWGPGTSIIAGNNAMGLALNMCLPVFWYLAHEERGFLKLLLYSMFFLSIPSIMFTYSRASALTLGLILIAIILRGRSRVLLLSALLIGSIVAVPFIPQKWWDRQKSTIEYEADASAMSRIDNWKFCWTLAVDRPLTGGGFFFFTQDTFARYAPQFLNTYGREWDTHSIYLGMLASHGFPGLFLFLLMIGLCMLTAQQLQRAVRHRPDLRWVMSYCYMVQVSFLALLINGAFANMEYFDLVYDWVAVIASLKVICYRALAETEVEEPESSEMVPVAVM